MSLCGGLGGLVGGFTGGPVGVWGVQGVAPGMRGRAAVAVAPLMLGAALLLSTQAVFAHKNHSDEPVVLAPGYRPLQFAAPPVGSYDLPVLFPAADAQVLDENGVAVGLRDLLRGKYTLLSFIYTSCDEVNGCPLASYVLSQTQQRIGREPLLRDETRLVSVSFDPQTDTPAVMKKYGAQFDSGATEWRFLTTASMRQLRPLLRDYDQAIAKETDEAGNHSGNISHILRVLLLDRAGFARNIYSVSFLHADTIVNDLKTLRAATATATATAAGPTATLRRHGAGDDRSGYERPDYRTDSKSLPSRTGQSFDLLRLVENPPLGLGRPDIPTDNPITKAKLELGRQLFFDRRLSHNNTFSCAMCHIPEQGFTSHELATAVGVEGRTARRNAPTLYNVAYAEALFHDAREFTLEQQIWSPLLARNEMANPSPGYLLQKLSRIEQYRRGFAQVFPEQGLGMETLGQALASYQRALLSANSPFDRWRYGGEANAMSARAMAGFGLFVGKGGCAACHTIGEESAMFTDNQLHNTGIGYRATMHRPPQYQQVQIAPGVKIKINNDSVTDATAPRPGDLGLYEITNDPDDRWKYRTPTLRNVALTAPYMHDGSLADLTEVVEFYNRGGVANPLRDPLIKPLGLSATETQALVAFLRALTGDNVDTIISDAFAQAVGNVE